VYEIIIIIRYIGVGIVNGEILFLLGTGIMKRILCR
jgi:hypothetical protein